MVRPQKITNSFCVFFLNGIYRPIHDSLGKASKKYLLRTGWELFNFLLFGNFFVVKSSKMFVKKKSYLEGVNTVKEIFLNLNLISTIDTILHATSAGLGIPFNFYCFF